MLDRIRRAAIFAALILVIAALAAACSDSEDSDADAGLTAAEVEAIVQDALDSQPAPEPGPSAAEIEAIVRSAAESMAAPASEPGLSAAEVEAIVQDALDSQPAPEPGLSIADVISIVQAAVDALPEPDPGLSAEDVEALVHDALEDLPEPEPGISVEEVSVIAQSVASTIPPRSEPAEYTKFFADNAVSLYETFGLEATLDYYNSEDSVDGQWYAFVLELNGDIIGHYDPDVRGLNLSGPIGTDINGYNFGADMITADEDGKWVSYVFHNPATGELGSKHSWVVEFEGLLFGSGWYTDPAGYTQTVVESAIERYETEGIEATLAHYNDPDNIDGQWYVVIIDEAGDVIGHYDPDVRGASATGPISTDVNDYNFGADMITADEDGKWVSYVFNNPATGELESKHSWVVEFDGLFFSSGWYTEPAGYTQTLVDNALAMYEEDGLEATLDYYNSEDSVDGQWYVFVLELNGDIIGHYDPESRGQNLSGPIGTDVNGYNFGPDMLTADEDGKWVSYVFHNPATGELGSKHSWVIERDGLLFGSGWYTDPASYTQSVVESAIERYEAEGIEASIAYHNDPDNTDGQWYVFIIGADGYTVSHYRPEFIGRDPSLRVDATGYFYGDDILSADENGKWVSYVFISPTSGEHESKHSWIVRRGDYFFGSGWYETTAN